MVKAEYIVYL